MLVRKQFQKRVPSRHGAAGSPSLPDPSSSERMPQAYIRRSRALDIKIDRALKEAKQRLVELQGSLRK